MYVHGTIVTKLPDPKAKSGWLFSHQEKNVPQRPLGLFPHSKNHDTVGPHLNAYSKKIAFLRFQGDCKLNYSVLGSPGLVPTCVCNTLIVNSIIVNRGGEISHSHLFHPSSHLNVGLQYVDSAVCDLGKQTQFGTWRDSSTFRPLSQSMQLLKQRILA